MLKNNLILAQYDININKKIKQNKINNRNINEKNKYL